MSPFVAAVSLTLDANVYNAAEGIPTVQVCVVGSVATGKLSDIAGQSFEVNLALSDGTATGLCSRCDRHAVFGGIIILCWLCSHKGAGVDYNWTATPAALNLVFDSTNFDVPQCVDIDIIDDIVVESTEDFDVDLTLVTPNPVGQITLGTSSAAVFIADNDGKHYMQPLIRSTNTCLFKMVY